jgi:tRNA (cytidine/uridine-2'-O-)-methyltransferase
MQIVLIEPQIPQNTGSIARTCAATETALHIVGEIPFEISEKRVRRAGLDYWPWVKLERHSCWDDFLRDNALETCWFFSKFGSQSFWDARFESDSSLVFGSETTGLGREFLASVPNERIISIPMSCSSVRSLNLSNAVSIGLFEALRQVNTR